MRPRSRFGANIAICTGAVDKFGKTVDSLLCADRSVSSARAFFCKALETHHLRRAQKVNLNGKMANHAALRLLRQQNPGLKSVVISSSRYLNNIVEQDHRAIKRCCAPMLALKSFSTAAVTLAGVELTHRIRKRQFSLRAGGAERLTSFKHLWMRALKQRRSSPPSRSKKPKSPMQQNSIQNVVTQSVLAPATPACWMGLSVPTAGTPIPFVVTGSTWISKPFVFPAMSCIGVPLSTTE